MTIEIDIFLFDMVIGKFVTGKFVIGKLFTRKICHLEDLSLLYNIVDEFSCDKFTYRMNSYCIWYCHIKLKFGITEKIQSCWNEWLQSAII